MTASHARARRSTSARTLVAPPEPTSAGSSDRPADGAADDRTVSSSSFVDDIFDPAGLGALPSTPLIPDATLRRRHAFVPSDGRFRAACRFLQCFWREDRNLPVGSYVDIRGKRHKLGSRISAAAGRSGANFVNPAVARLVRRELLYREVGAVIEEDRLHCNLLSSQPLTFNLFGALKLDPALATAVCQQLLPGFFREVVDLRFEHSPARGHAAFTADGTAFDALIRGYTPSGARAFVAIEVKYTESGHEPLPRFSGCHNAIAAASGLFVDPHDAALRQAPIQQLFRQASLGIAMLDQNLYDLGLHLLVAPKDNLHVQRAAAIHASHLKDPEAGRLPFRAITLEAFIGALAEAGAPDLARQLYRRYCDFHLLEGELELDDSSDEVAGPPIASAA